MLSCNTYFTAYVQLQIHYNFQLNFKPEPPEHSGYRGLSDCTVEVALRASECPPSDKKIIMLIRAHHRFINSFISSAFHLALFTQPFTFRFFMCLIKWRVYEKA
jgi:hypothetical protein